MPGLLHCMGVTYLMLLVWMGVQWSRSIAFMQMDISTLMSIVDGLPMGPRKAMRMNVSLFGKRISWMSVLPPLTGTTSMPKVRISWMKMLMQMVSRRACWARVIPSLSRFILASSSTICSDTMVVTAALVVHHPVVPRGELWEVDERHIPHLFLVVLLWW